MIAVDTSALLAIVFDEPEREAFGKAIADADAALVSVVSIVEARMVTFGRRGANGMRVLDGVLGLPKFELVSPGTEEIDIAHAAFAQYGKGSGHRARLNFGDLFSYALAKARGVPLLYKGNDFIHTDIQPAIV
jgi:ribonuclease VapC